MLQSAIKGGRTALNSAGSLTSALSRRLGPPSLVRLGQRLKKPFDNSVTYNRSDYLKQKQNATNK